MIAAPITGDDGPLGVIEVYAKERGGVHRDRRGPGRGARQPGRHRDHERPADRRAGSLPRASWPGPPTPSGRCARSPAGSARRTTRTRSCRPSSTPPSGCCGATGAMIDLIGDTGMAEAWTNRDVGVRASSNIDLLGEVEPRDRRRRVRPRDPDPPGRVDRRLPRRRRGSPTRLSATRSCARAGSSRSSRPRSSTATWSSARSPSTATGPTRSTPRTRRCWRPWPTRRPSRSPTPASSTSSSGRARRSPGAPTPSGRCARSPPASRPSSTRPRSSSGSSTRRPACSSRTAPGSTCTTPRSTPCAGRTRRATRCPRIPEWARPAASSPGRRSPARPSPSSARSGPTTTSPTTGSSTTTRAAAFVTDAGIRSVIAVPLAGDAAALSPETTPLGTLSVVSRRPGAYDEADGEVLTALATQASIAIGNARLIEELARSRAVIERRAEAERTLREIAARITAIREPGDLLQRDRRRGTPAPPGGRRGHRRVRRREGVAGHGLRRGPDRGATRVGPVPAAADRRGPVRAGRWPRAGSSPPATTWRASSSTSSRRTRWPARPASAT